MTWRLSRTWSSSPSDNGKKWRSILRLKHLSRPRCHNHLCLRKKKGSDLFRPVKELTCSGQCRFRPTCVRAARVGACPGRAGPGEGGGQTQKSGTPKGGGPGRPRVWEPHPAGPIPDPPSPPPGSPKFRFFPPATIFILSSLSWEVFSRNFGGVLKRGPEMCTFGLSGCRVTRRTCFLFAFSTTQI